VPKLRFEPSEHFLGLAIPKHKSDFAVAFGGAGHGPFIDKLVENAWQNSQAATSLDGVCDEIEKSIKATYKEFGEIYQSGFCPSAQLIYGVKMHNNSRLFTAHGPVVNETDGYDSQGIGYYLADFICKRMYNHALTLKQCAILAAYVLFQVKENVDGCGGESHIAILRNGGSSGLIDNDRIEQLSKLLSWSDQDLGQILLAIADLEISDDNLKAKFEQAVELTKLFRDQAKQDIRSADDRHDMFSGTEERDFFGLPPDKAKM